MRQALQEGPGNRRLGDDSMILSQTLFSIKGPHATLPSFDSGNSLPTHSGLHKPSSLPMVDSDDPLSWTRYLPTALSPFFLHLPAALPYPPLLLSPHSRVIMESKFTSRC